MFGKALPAPRPRSEAERPFWISYADLMTAMMTLCLVVMAVTIIAISQRLNRELSGEDRRAEEIREICSQIQGKLPSGSGIAVDCKDNRIYFGEAGRFDHNEFKLAPGGEAALARIVPVILEVADGDVGKKWFKQVVIEGYTDTQGSYLYNLELSLRRSYWVMCMLTDPRMNSGLGLTSAQVQRVRDLFLAGGVSFNDAKDSLEASRRVELRLQFWSRKELEAGARDARPRIISTGEERCRLT